MERCSPHGRQEAKRRKREGKGEKEGARERKRQRQTGVPFKGTHPTSKSFHNVQ
jgi:hypothetical protein